MKFTLQSTRLLKYCFILSRSIVGVIKGVITTVIGLFTFGGVPLSILTIAGIVLNTMGGILYGYGKYRDKMTAAIGQHFIDHTLEVAIDKKSVSHSSSGVEECEG